MALDFPANPTNGMVYSNYIFDSSITAWRNVNTDTGIGTLNAMGLKNVVPTSVTVNAGSATINANGTISVSSANTITVNNAFTSTYDSYLIKVSLSSNGTNLIFRLANSSGTAITTGYAGAYFFTSTSGGTGAGSNSASGTYYDVSSSANGDGCEIRVTNPNNPVATSMMNSSMQGTAPFFGGSYHNATTAYPSFVLTMASGNAISGTIQVYGYSN